MIARAVCLCLGLALLAGAASAQNVARIVYVGVEDDPYYAPRPVYTGLSLRDRARPVDGARVAMRGTRVLARALGLEFELEEVLVQPGGSAEEAIRAAWADGAVAILLDLPADVLSSALDQIGSGPGVHFNIRHRGAEWRAALCQTNLLHTIPSHAMLQDALAQYLRARNWEKVLLLTGDTPEDVAEAAAVRASAAKFGLRIVVDRQFQLSNDPRNRDQNNIALLTGGAGHDVVWIVDNDGEFGRYVPYATYAARPVVGSEGLTPRAWHWTYERHGAPQLNQRFRRSTERDMTSEDWAAWAAVRAVIEAVQRVGGAEAGAVNAFIASDAFRLDLYKGVPGSVRPWNGQLRQPVLLTTHNAVIAVAPLDGFEHRTDTLDTLGIDLAENACKR